MPSKGPASDRPKSTVKIPKLSTQHSPAPSTAAVDQKNEIQPVENQPFTFDQVRTAWMEFAETRKPYKAEYQLLTQEIILQEKTIVLHLHNPVQETLLSDLKSDIVDYIREKIKNYSLQVIGELQHTDDHKAIYTNREKFEHLAKKNPNLYQLKDRLGLDQDF